MGIECPHMELVGFEEHHVIEHEEFLVVHDLRAPVCALTEFPVLHTVT